MDTPAVREFTLWLLNPRNTASWIYESYRLKLDGAAAFSRTLRDFTAFEDYLDILEQLPNKKRKFDDFLRSQGQQIKLSPRWTNLIKTLTHKECDLLWQALDLKVHGISRRNYWKCMRVLHDEDEEKSIGKCRPPSAEYFSHGKSRRSKSLKVKKTKRNPFPHNETYAITSRDTLRKGDHILSPAASLSRSAVDEAIVILEPPSSRLRKRSQTSLVSSHFTSPSEPKSRRLPAGTSAVPFPSITAPRFGLVQERLWNEPFKLLIAVIFLNKTRGQTAMPIYNQLMTKYTTPLALSEAKVDDISTIIWHLGLQTQRAKKLINLASAWTSSPPQLARRYRTVNYPTEGDGRTLKPSELITEDADLCAGALEIGHLPGCGPYAWDSWRIFCRDVLRGVAEDYNGAGADAGFEPEWKRVVPLDKELRAFLRWMWLREGWVWDPLTGKKRRADKEEMRSAREGGDMIEGDEGGVGLVSQPVAGGTNKKTIIIDLPYEPSRKESTNDDMTKTHTRRTRSNTEY